MLGDRVQPGGVERVTDGPCLRGILCGIALACALLLAPADGAYAGTLYRCTGVSGETAYTTSTAGYRSCQAIERFGAPAARRATAKPVQRSSLTLASGAVETTARSLGADGTRPVTFVNAQAGAQTSARALAAAAARRASLAAVTAGVATDARAPAWVTPASPGPGRVLRGSVYRVARTDGSVEYTNVRPPAGGRGHVVTMLFSYIATCAACDLHSPIHWNSVPLNLTAYAQAIHAASLEYRVDEAFLRAVIHAESAFNPRALSYKGAQGLMQLMPGTANDLGVLDAFDTAQNIRGGARYLGTLLQDFAGNERLAAAAYNAGPGAVQRYGGVPPYAETQVYVERVGTLRKRYAAAIRSPLAAGLPLIPVPRS